MFKRSLIVGSVLTAVLLTGCQSISEKKANFDNREETLTNVVGQVWRLDAKWPGVIVAKPLSDHLYTTAKKHCDKKGFGMLPIKGSSTPGSEDGKTPATAWLEFRCQAPLDYRPAYKGITATINPEDLEDVISSKN